MQGWKQHWVKTHAGVPLHQTVIVVYNGLSPGSALSGLILSLRKSFKKLAACPAALKDRISRTSPRDSNAGQIAFNQSSLDRCRGPSLLQVCTSGAWVAT